MYSRVEAEAFMRAIGRASVGVGDPFTAGGLTPLGVTEGAVEPNFEADFNDLTFPEQTGPLVHARSMRGESLSVDIPLIVGNPELWARVSPTGLAGGGYSGPRDVEETALVLFPQSDVPVDGELSYDGTAWSPGPPENALWIWRGHFSRMGPAFQDEDGGRTVRTATFQALYYAPNPEGHKLFTIGDPTEADISVLI